MSNLHHRGLFVPANPFEPCRYIFGSFNDMRNDLNCTLLEFVYVWRPHAALPADKRFVFIGDEEARLKNEFELNPRATWLAGYDYLLAGDMVLFEDNDADIKSVDDDLLAKLTKAIIHKGAY